MNRFDRDLSVWRLSIDRFIKNNISLLNLDNVLEIGKGESSFILDSLSVKYKLCDTYIGHNPDYTYDICNWPETEEKFTSIFCCEVLEHTKYPWLAAINIVKLLNDGGRVLITCPSFLGWHPMIPLCGDYWRFLPGHIEYLFPSCKIIKSMVCPNDKVYPLGVGYILEK